MVREIQAPIVEQDLSFSHQLSIEVIGAQLFAEAKNAKEYEERHTNAWKALCTPEEIARRHAEHEKMAALALENGLVLAKSFKEYLGLTEDDDIPIPDELPAHMKGQSISTIKAMLRQERDTHKKLPNIFSNPLAQAIFKVKEK